MQISEVFAYLVQPQKSAVAPANSQGAIVQPTGQLFSLLQGIFDVADRECDIEVSFKSDNQQNDFRDLLLEFMDIGSMVTASVLADHLSKNTTRRSGIGLLFLIRGAAANARKVLISRFPTDQAIMVDDSNSGFNVQLLERVFMKNRHSYKAALYSFAGSPRSMWDGRVVDKQINGPDLDVSRYWVHDFLLSEFKVNSLYASQRMAKLIKAASQKMNFDEKKELHHIVGLAGNLNSKSVSLAGLLDHFHVSDGVKSKVLAETSTSIANQTFRFNSDEFGRHLSYRTVELDNGAILTSESAKFEDVFSTSVLEKGKDGSDVVQISTAGRLLSDRLKKSS